MSYVIEQSESLLAVLERAAPLSAHRLAGYAANAEFWASELQHCRELLDGYSQRYQRMKEGTENYLKLYPISSDRPDSDSRTTRATKDSEIKDTRRRIDEAADKFFSRLATTKLLSNDQIETINRILGEEMIEPR